MLGIEVMQSCAKPSVLCMLWPFRILFLSGIGGSVQDYGNSGVLAMELPQSCAKLSLYVLNL